MSAENKKKKEAGSYNSGKFKRSLTLRKVKKKFKKGTASFLKMLERRDHEPIFNLTKYNGKALSAKTIKKLKELIPDLSPSFKPLILGKQKAAQQTAFSPGGSVYRRDMDNTKLSVFIKNTPTKEPFPFPRHTLLFKTTDSKGIEKIAPLDTDASSRVEEFGFTVTAKKIHERAKQKRPCSQKAVFGGLSAFYYLLEIGLYLSKKQDGRNYHWAHREGWGLGGEQSMRNLDAMPAGANFATLFKIEDPIRQILFEGFEGLMPVDSVKVKGQVFFDNEKDIPFKIIYTLLWQDELKKMHQQVIYIDPLSDRKPTYVENLAAKKFWAIEMNKEFPVINPVI